MVLKAKFFGIGIFVSAIFLIMPIDGWAQDADGDGMPDSYENAYGCLMPNTVDSSVDYDSDGLTSLQEYQYFMVNPHEGSLNPCNPDTDGDGVNDGAEVAAGSDPAWAEVTPGIALVGTKDKRITYSENYPEYPSIAWTGTAFGLAWDDEDASYTYQAYFAGINADGDTVSSNRQVSSSSGDGYEPDIAGTGTEFGIIWYDYRSPTENAYFNRINLSGDTLGVDVMASAGIGSSYSPKIAWTGSEYGTVWYDYRDGNSEIYFRRIAQNGGLVSTDRRVTFNASNAYDPAITWSGSEYGMAWRDNRDGNYEIYFTRVSYNGFILGVDTRVTFDTQSEYDVDIVWTGSEYGLVWEGGPNYDIQFVRLAEDGSTVGPIQDLNPATDYGEYPSIAWTGSEFGVAWDDGRNPDYEIYLMRIAADGDTIGAEQLISSTADEGDAWYADITATSSGEYGLTYTDDRNNGYDQVYFALAGPDSDGDDLLDSREASYGTSPNDYDSDDDGIPDGFEVYINGSDPTMTDTDGDGIDDGDEVFLYLTNPASSDSDGDGLNDYEEIFTYGTDANDSDTDDDGLDDYAELNTYSTDPLDPDTDGDTLIDGDEINLFGTDPNSPDADSDADGLPDSVETNTGVYLGGQDAGTDPGNPDTDGDGVLDGAEVQAGSNPLLSAVVPGWRRSGPQMPVSSSSLGTYSPCITWSGSEYGVAWTDYRASNPDIYFARLAPDGNTIGAAGVVTGNTSSQYSPTIAWGGFSNVFMVAWQDRRNGNYEIYTRRVTYTGVPTGSEYRITNTTTASYDPSLSTAPSEFGLTWSDSNSGSWQIYFNRLYWYGGAYGSVRQVSSSSGGGELPSIVWSGSEYGVSWGDWRGPYEQLYFSRLLQNGDTVSPDQQFTSSPNSIYYSDLAWADGEWGLVWEDNRLANDQIFFAHATAAGDTIGTDYRVSTTPNDAYYPALAWSGSGYGVVWYAYTGGQDAIGFGGVAGDGSPIGTNILVSDTVGEAYDPDIVWTGSEFGVVWENYYLGDDQIYFARVSYDTDGDGLTDVDEPLYATDSHDWDSDDDGVSDGDEVLAYGSNPLNPDTDGDGLSDYAEIFTYGTNPSDSDTDHDGLSDYAEVNTYFTDPLNADTDGDGVNDGAEISAGSNPFWAEVTPGIVLVGLTDKRITYSENYPELPAIAWTGTAFGLAWDDENSAYDYQIFFAGVNSDGDTVGPNRQVSSSPSDSYYGDIAGTDAEFGVVWQDYRPPTENVYFNSITLSGDTLGADVQASSGTGSTYSPKVAWSGSEYGVAWYDYRDGNSEIYFRLLTRNGIPLSTDQRLTFNASSSYDPCITWSGSEYGIAWYDSRDGNSEIYFTRVSASGVPLGVESRITFDTQGEYDVDIVWTGSEYGLAWDGGPNYDNQFVRLAPDGSTVGPARDLDPLTAYGYNPAIAWTGSEFGVAWEDGRNPYYEIYLMRLAADGTTLGPEQLVTSITDEGDAEYVDLTATSAGEYGVVYVDDRNDGYDQIYFALVGPDSDGDDLSDSREAAYGTSPNNWDSDGDGVPDGFEVYVYGSDPAVSDSDGDGINDGDEIFLYLTDPTSPDTDGDGLNDYEEIFTYGTDPNNTDTDGDGLSDYEELNTYSTNPLNPDTDGDGLTDGDEVNILGTDPNSPDADADNDGLPDSLETNTGIYLGPTNPGTDPANPDTDGDGSSDGDEVRAGSNPLLSAVCPRWLKRGAESRITDSSAYAYEPKLAWSGSEYAVVWTDGRDGNPNPYFARISTDGSTVGSPYVLTSNTSNQYAPDIAWGHDRYMTVYLDYRNGNYEIYARSMLSYGIGYSERRITYNANTSYSPAIAAGPTNEWGLAWTDNYTGVYRIHFVRIDEYGYVLTSPLRASQAPSGADDASIAWSGSEYGVAWEDWRGSYSDIYFTRLSATGDTVTPDLRATSTPDDVYYPDIAWADNEWGLAWEDYRFPDEQIFMGRLAPDGDTIGQDHRVANSPSYADEPSIAWSGSQYGVAWYQDSPTYNYEVTFAGMLPDGNTIGPPVTVSNPLYDGYEPDIAWTGSEYGVVWEDYRDGQDQVYFARIGFDTDGDWLTDLDEPSYGTDPDDWDTDDDGLYDGLEVLTLGTSPTNPDTDGDGLEDGFEVQTLGSDPLSDGDLDGDGLTDSQEVLLYGTDPSSIDTDEDGLTDYQEVIIYGTNPWEFDSDGDGISDWDEVYVTFTNPALADTDGDGIPDGQEVQYTQADYDQDQMPNAWEKQYSCLDIYAGDSTGDPDGDGLTNLQEFNLGTDPCQADTDGDGLDDGYEVNTSLTNPASPDTDGDGLDDNTELSMGTDPNSPDTDGDSYNDGREVGEGTDPLDPNDHPVSAHLINYQGKLNDSVGAAVGGTVTMTFRIFDVSLGGTAIWQETQDVHVEEGIYNVLLGSVTTLDPGLFTATYHPAIYLEVEVNGEALSPRARITSVPMTMFADQLMGGRLEMGTRGFNAPVASSAVTVHVSFEKAFAFPPQVLVSPPDGKIGGIYFAAGSIENITTLGFDVTFISQSGAKATGAANFTYQAFGH